MSLTAPGKGPTATGQWVCISEAALAHVSLYMPSFRLIRCVLRGLISMASLPSSEAATPPPSTVHSSVYESSWDPLLLSETDARGSDESPCRAYHPMTFPRDGHLPSNDATGSDEFPAKPAVTEWGGVDEMGPWLRVKDTDRLLLCDRTVHWSPLEQVILPHAMLLCR